MKPWQKPSLDWLLVLDPIAIGRLSCSAGCGTNSSTTTPTQSGAYVSMAVSFFLVERL